MYRYIKYLPIGETVAIFVYRNYIDNIGSLYSVRNNDIIKFRINVDMFIQNVLNISPKSKGSLMYNNLHEKIKES